MGQTRKAAVLGLDGVPFTLLSQFFEMGLMPNLASVAVTGTFLPMSTVLPAVSSVAWTSFMTGKNPGEHGIFGFTDLKPGQISLHLPSFDDIRCPTLWQELSDRNTVVVNLPFTFPARPLRGALIAGFVAPVFDRSIYPESLIPWLKSIGYRFDIDAARCRQDRRYLVQELFETLYLHGEVMLNLMDGMHWDLFIGVITGTDRLHHFLFDAYEDTGHPYHQDFLEFYRGIDSFFGRFLDRISGGTRLIILSDHGFTRLESQVYLNHILKTRGYLRFQRTNPSSLEDIDPSSLAFALEPGRIYLNSHERFKAGRLNLHQALEVREKLKNELHGLTPTDIGIHDSGAKDRKSDRLFAEVRTREELFQGACLEVAPDLLVIPEAGYDLKASLNPPGAAMRDLFTGTHTHDDALLIVDDPSIADRLPTPMITDVAQLVTEALK
jgi:predicted AlkP superfamily phosphohydrolase/phosphomutase